MHALPACPCGRGDDHGTDRGHGHGLSGQEDRQREAEIRDQKNEGKGLRRFREQGEYTGMRKDRTATGRIRSALFAVHDGDQRPIGVMTGADDTDDRP
jgi:hypothetical protein